jgi:dTDP-4-amino-4,6-dideoxygalactose transaminase
MKVPFLDIQATYLELQSRIDEAVKRVLNSGWYILGQEVEQFERSFADYCGTKYCVGLGNGLEALHLLLRAYEIGPGDEVIVPSNTYIATWLAVSQAGAEIVPVEPDPLTFNIDPSLLERAITSKTRAIMPVHLYGLACDMDAIMEIARRYGIKVIDDCAQAQGTGYKGRKAGSLADASAFSFYPTKNLGCVGDGGAVTTDDDDIADRVRLLRNYGARVKYYNEIQGYNSRLDPIQAAILNVKLSVLDEWNDRRRKIAAFYDVELQGLPGLILPVEPTGHNHIYHVYAIRYHDREKLISYLNNCGIGTLIHYPIPPHKSQAYSSTALGERSFRFAEAIADTVISIPMGPHLSMEQAEAVVEAFRSFTWKGN